MTADGLGSARPAAVPGPPKSKSLNEERPATPAADLVEIEAVPPRFEGFDGFLGTRASLGMDVVLVGLLALLPVLAWSIAAVRAGRYQLHKRLQLFIVAALTAAIVVFEVDVRIFSDWKVRALPSPWYPAGVFWSLGIHLVFAVSTFVLWTWVVWEAVLRFPAPPTPGGHGPRHRRMARLAALDLLGTAVTGVIFYWLAFVA